jgi:hypothetical protein
MPVTVFLVGVVLGTEAYSHSYALNMLVVAVGTGIASHGELNFSVLGVMYQVRVLCSQCLVQVCGHHHRAQGLA